MDLFTAQPVAQPCAECAAGGHVYRFDCTSCVCRWFWRLPRKFKAAVWKSRPDLHDRLRAERADTS